MPGDFAVFNDAVGQVGKKVAGKGRIVLHRGAPWFSIWMCWSERVSHLIFVGTYDHTIDDKGRVAIPADIRADLASELQDGRPVRLYVTLGDRQSLALYTEAMFKKRGEELDQSEADPEAVLKYETYFYGLASRQELDKAGRIRLPENLMRMVGLETKSNVVLIGVKDRLEIRDRQAWQEHLLAELDANPQLMMNPRLAMRKLSPDGHGSSSDKQG